MKSPVLKTALKTLTAIVFSTSIAQAGPITSVVGFGDSIVDSGNTQIAAIDAFGPAADPTPAALGYFQGRFSNGPNYLDIVTRQVTGSLGTPALVGGNNFSFGGARAADNGDFLPDLAAQVGLYLLGAGGTADPNTLYVINAGGNDVRDFVTGALGSLTKDQFIAGVVAVVTAQTALLAATGAENIMVADIANVGIIPEILALDGATFHNKAIATDLVMELNALLWSSLESLNLGVNLLHLPVFDIGQAILDDPAKFGLPAGLITNPSCLVATGGAGGPNVDCSNFAFFDQVHPTAAIHQIIGTQAILIARIPEPATGLLLLTGLGGFMLRKRRKITR